MAQMRSRREQVDAHRFITSRMNQALVLANPDSVERPLRRIGVSIFASVMIMVLIFGGFAIAALLNKGNDAPELNSIIITKGTTAVYVYTYGPDESEENGDDPKLWPVANYTSALLLLEPYEGEPPVQELKPESLSGVPRGFTVGISGAPPEPPAADSLLQHENWNACSMPRELGSTSAFMLTQLVAQDMTEPSWLAEEGWMLAQSTTPGEEDADSRYYLLADDKKFEIDENEQEQKQVFTALALQQSDAVPVTQDVLNTIADGPAMDAHDEPGFGEDSSFTDTDGEPMKFGQTVEADDRLYVLLRDDNGEEQFAPIGESMRRLLQARGDLGTKDTEPVQSTLVTDTGAAAAYEKEGFPQELRDQVSFDTDQPAVCAVFDPDAPQEEADLEIAYYSTAPKDLTEPAESVSLDSDGLIESNIEGQRAQVVVPPGSAALVTSQSSPGSNIEGFSYLIDSLGSRYGLVDVGPSGSTRQLLGYDGVDPVGVPDSMLQLIPKGADLDPAEAKNQLDPNSEDVPVYETGEEEGEEGVEGGEGGEGGG